MSARVVTVQLIIAQNATRGRGVGGDPIRRLTEIYSPDGRLLAVRDPTTGDLRAMHDLFAFLEEVDS